MARRQLSRLVRAVERRTGGGPYSRIGSLEERLARARDEVARLTGELSDVRERRDTIQGRLDHARSQLQSMPAHALGWAAAAPRVLYTDSGAPNPYLRLLYHRLPDAGLWPVPRRQPLDDEVGAPDVLHVHWLPDLEIADDAADARRRVDAYLGRLDTALERGARLVRTVHELHGHDERFPELTRRTHAALYERAHTVHLLHTSTRDELRAAYSVEPERTFVVAHPLYTSWYPDLLPREEARRRLGITDDDILLLGFGAIRHYKGFDRLLDIAGRLDRRVRLLIAGPAPIDANLSALLARVTDASRVRIETTRVPDDVIHVLFRAADLCVLPYRPGSLTSGVLFLAWTFDTPVIAPRNPATEDLAVRGPLRVFDANSDDDLEAVISTAIADGWYGAQPVDATVRDEFAPERISGVFAESLAARLG